MIRIYCGRDYLYGWEKIRYAQAISTIIGALKEFQRAVSDEKAVEVEYRVIVKIGGEDGQVIDAGRSLSALQH